MDALRERWVRHQENHHLNIAKIVQKLTSPSMKM
jgi:hypothetical protein